MIKFRYYCKKLNFVDPVLYNFVPVYELYLINESTKIRQLMLNKLVETCKEYGMKINEEKKYT